MALTTEEKIKCLERGLLEIKNLSSTLTEDTLLDSLGLDSLDIVELQLFIEEDLGIVIKDPEEEIATVRQLIALIE